MDLERATLRTLFYDYPIEVAEKHIANLPCQSGKDNFLTVFPQVIRWTEQQFSISELRLVEYMLEYEAREVIHEYDPQNTNLFRNTLCLIPQVAKRWLTYNEHNNVAVQFKELFRWRDMTMLVGEDVFTTAFLAVEDMNKFKASRDLFVWEDVLHHENKTLNEILKQENVDVHSHYNASVDVFHLNWLSLMNRISNRFDFNKGEYQEQGVSLHAIEQLFSMRNICVAAAYLRVWLFRFINIENKNDFNFNLFCDVEQILKDDQYCTMKQEETQGQIDILKYNALRDIDGHSVDYALCDSNECVNTIDTPYLIYHGERQLLYQLFRYVFDNNTRAADIAPYIYLYLLLKNRIRREIVETNRLLGFENFQIYQSRKDLYVSDNKDSDQPDNVFNHLPQFIFKLNTNKEQSLEARITPSAIKKVREQAYYRPIFHYEEQLEDVAQKMELVVHFIKDSQIPYTYKKGKNRIDAQEHYQNLLKKQAELVISEINKQKALAKESQVPRIVGIDAASTELYCRPERFGHVYRYFEVNGIVNRTYHVGEDFFDIVDGLRAIDEAIEFLHLDNNCRIGHALALGTNACKYYPERHFTTITTKQNMLDSLVWLYQKSYENNINISGKLFAFIQNNATRLYNEIGYCGSKEKLLPFDFLHYWHSMWLRSNDETDNRKVFSDEWNLSAKYEGKYSSIVKDNNLAETLFEKYQKSDKIFSDGSRVEIFKWPKEIIEVVTQLQDKMIAEIAEKQIAIECNPSSNLKIGHFDRYDEHPIFRFRPIDKNIHTPLLNVSINTDDRGVFATSLYNEFSLIALALTKQRDKEGNRLYNDEAICEYIDHIRQNNLIQRFKVD